MDMKIGFGGGCHWCTEAVFQALTGVSRVEQGFIAAPPPYDRFSEAVIVHYKPSLIPLSVLIEVHLCTHASMSAHSMRPKYRSAVYAENMCEIKDIKRVLDDLSTQFEAPLVTLALKMNAFKASSPRFQNYYKIGPKRPFCTAYIDPKLARLRCDFAAYL